MTEIVDEHFLARYRELLDTEEAAFDELEHAFEDGDRVHFENDYSIWQQAVAQRQRYLDQHGVTPYVTTE